MRTLPLLTVALTLAIAAPAGAQAISSATPAAPGNATRLHVDVDATQPPVAARVPSSLVLSVPGFTIDRRAAAKRCTRLRATLNECPKESRIGSGTLLIGVTMPERSRDVPIRLVMYMNSATRLYAVAFVTGWRVVPGVLDTANGLTLRFDPLPKPPQVVPDISFTLKRLTLDLGATARVATGARKRTRKGHKPRVKLTRVDLLHTPPTCAGSWPTTVTLGFPDATTALMDAPTPCAPA